MFTASMQAPSRLWNHVSSAEPDSPDNSQSCNHDVHPEAKVLGLHRISYRCTGRERRGCDCRSLAIDLVARCSRTHDPGMTIVMQ